MISNKEIGLAINTVFFEALKAINNFLKLWAALFLVLCHAMLFSQPAGYGIKHYTSDNGLPQNSVSGITFDKKGFLWIATQGGICCFDGQNFRGYNILNTPILKSNRLCGIYTKPKGDIGFFDDRRNFYSISSNFAISADGMMDVSGLFMGDAQRFFIYENIFKNPNWPRNREGNISFPVYPKARVIINDHECYTELDHRLFFLDNINNIVQDLGIPASGTNKYPNAVSVGDLYIYCRKKGPAIFLHGKPQKNIILTSQARSLTESIYRNKGRILNNSLVLVNRDIYLLRQHKDTITASILIHKLEIDLNDITCAVYDSANDLLCLGSNLNGLFLLNRNTIKTLQNGIFYDVIYTGNYDFLNDKEIFNIHTNQSSRLSSSIWPASLFKASDGHVWCLSNRVLCRSRGDLTSFYPVKRLSNLLNLLSVPCFLKDGSGHSWTAFDNSIWSIKKNGTIKKLLDVGKKVTLMFHYDANTLWLLTNEGVFAYKIPENKVVPIPIFAGLPIRSIFRAGDGSIWIGTYGKGMYRYQNQTLIQLPMDGHRCLENAHNFFEDKKGFFWIPTNNGLIQCLKNDLEAFIKDSSLMPYYYRYDQTDGLVTNEFNGSANSPYDTTDDGEIVYPSIKGAVFFSPLLMKPKTGTFEFFIESITIDNKVVNLSQEIDIPPSFGHMEVKIAYPFFGNPENLKIEYNVEGLNNEWYRLNANKLITLNRLPHGSYSLVIRKKNGFGKNNYTYNRLRFKVLQMPYETWWFSALCTLLVILIFAVMYGLKNRSQARSKMRLEHEVKVRTQDLDDAVKQLNATVNELYESESKLLCANEVKEKVISIILHDIKAPLRYLSLAASGFRREIGNMDKQELENFSTVFAEQTFRTNIFVDDLLQWLLSQKKMFKPNPSVFLINVLFEEVGSVYKEIAKIKGNTIKINLQKEMEIFADRHILKLILQNLIDNAIKNTIRCSTNFCIIDNQGS